MNDKSKNTVIVVIIIALAIGAFYLYNKNSKKKAHEDLVPAPNTNTTTEANSNDNTTPGNTNNEAVIEQKEIKDLDISLRYGSEEVDIEYEVKKDGKIEAKVEDRINKVHLRGEEAQIYIESNFLNINFNNPQSEVVDEILSTLNLGEDFNKIEVEVEYQDLTKNSIEIVQ